MYAFKKRAAYVKNVLSQSQPELDFKALEYMSLKKGDYNSAIYGIYNIITKNLYVGSTNNFHKRFVGHQNCLRTGKTYRSILSDLNKTGFDSFFFIKIMDVEPKQLIEAENYWIESLGATYNSNKAVELKIPIESKRRARVDGIKTMAHYSSPVVKYDFSGEVLSEYTSIRAAAVEHGGKHLAYLITKNCRGKTDSAFGAVWKYKNGMTLPKPKHVKQLVQKAIVQIDAETGEFIKMWESSIQAAEFYGLKPQSIRYVCESKKKAAGYLWRYANLKNFRL